MSADFVAVGPLHLPFDHMTGTTNTTDLAHCRQQMAASRLESIGTKAFYFDSSPTGAGKSTADIAAISIAKNSISFLPSHSQCQELVGILAKHDISAAAYPPLDETTCQIYGPPEKPGVAQIAQRSGLSVGESICPECPFQKGCEYQRRREASRRADHVIATHARAASSGFEAAAGKELIFIHEDAISLLRPTLRAASAFALQPVITVARTMKDVAERLGDDQKVEFAESLFESTRRLVEILAEESFLKASENDPTAPKVRSVPLQSPLPRPPRLDMVLFKAIQASGVRPDGDALRLATAYCCGELDQLCLVVEERFLKGGERRRLQVLVGTAKVEPPLDAAVWFEDATSPAEGGGGFPIDLHCHSPRLRLRLKRGGRRSACPTRFLRQPERRKRTPIPSGFADQFRLASGPMKRTAAPTWNGSEKGSGFAHCRIGIG